LGIVRIAMLYFPDDISDAMTVCALRFDGYRYEEDSGLSTPDATGAGLRGLIEPVVETLVFYADDNANFAVFFGLQRYLHKWGGDHCTKYSEEHIAYDWLFLHLYRKDVPAAFRHSEYYIRWRREYEERQEEIAGFVRNSFRRRGRGAKIAI
jgi:hypothetical protein